MTLQNEASLDRHQAWHLPVRTHQGLLSLPLVSGGYVHLRPSLILAVADDDVPGHKCDVAWSIDDDGSRYACTSPVNACSLES